MIMVAQAAKSAAPTNADGATSDDVSVAEARGLSRALDGLLNDFAKIVKELQSPGTSAETRMSGTMKLMVHAAAVKKLDAQLRRVVSQTTARSQPILAEAGRAKMSLIKTRTTWNSLQSELKKYSEKVPTAALDKLDIDTITIDTIDPGNVVDVLRGELEKRKKLGVKLHALRKTKHERNSKLMKNKAKGSMLPKCISIVGKSLKQLAQFEEDLPGDETKNKSTQK